MQMQEMPAPATVLEAIHNPKTAMSYIEAARLKNAAVSACTDINASCASVAAAAAAPKHFCNNCNRVNHLYNNCRAPITSIGVIAFRSGQTGPDFLMIRRRDSFGFVDFVRGKY